MTVGIVVVSHSSKIAEGAVELAAQMAPDVELVAAGGTDDDRIGTSLEKVLAAVEQSLVDSGGDGVVVLTDLGSAVMTAESAMEFASNPDAVQLADAPLVEGLVAAAVAAQGGAGVEDVRKAAEAVSFGAGAEPGVGAEPGRRAEPADANGPVVPDASGDFELINPLGMHARPAAKIAGGLSGLDAEVTVNGADGMSIMALMALAAGQGSSLHVEARGKDASKAVEYVGRLVKEGFGEL
ncbi:dihydroxyacetone kinase phosphoryl donor subunit DhaM [Paenarthrobacter nicotinovorans]|uniref:dihydroxyacetone kinase phosphoryl donor subunit DhaM n=1 Tax=Paenarthrobacter nicotinovorans TaxID=29320 RepID=UPI003A803831